MPQHTTSGMSWCPVVVPGTMLTACAPCTHQHVCVAQGRTAWQRSRVTFVCAGQRHHCLHSSKPFLASAATCMLGELHRQSCEPGTSAWSVFYVQVEVEQSIRIATSSRLWYAVTVWSPNSWIHGLLWLGIRSPAVA